MIVGRRQKSGCHVEHVLDLGLSDGGTFEIGKIACDRRVRFELARVDQFRRNDASKRLGRGLQKLRDQRCAAPRDDIRSRYRDLATIREALGVT